MDVNNEIISKEMETSTSNTLDTSNNAVSSNLSKDEVIGSTEPGESDGQHLDLAPTLQENVSKTSTIITDLPNEGVEPMNVEGVEEVQEENPKFEKNTRDNNDNDETGGNENSDLCLDDKNKSESNINDKSSEVRNEYCEDPKVIQETNLALNIKKTEGVVRIDHDSGKEKTNIIEIDDEVSKEEEASQCKKDSIKEEDDIKLESADSGSGGKHVMVIEIDDDEDDDSGCTDKSANKTSSIEVTANLDDIKVQSDDLGPSVDMEVETNLTQTSDVIGEESGSLLEAKDRTKSPNKEDTTMADDEISDEIYYNKECVNYECPQRHKQFFRAPLFALSYFKIVRKKYKQQYICVECYDKALDIYEEFCGLLAAKQPLLLKPVLGKQEFVEIIDSSDEDATISDIENGTDSYLAKDDIKMIETELDDSIRRVLDRVEIQSQMTWSKTILMSRVQALEKEVTYIDEQLQSLQKKADQMHVNLYQTPKIKYHHIQPLDLNTGKPYTLPDMDDLPPNGDVIRPPIQLNETYYAVKTKAIASWVPCKVLEEVDSATTTQKNVKHYKIKYLKTQCQTSKTLSAKHLAYYDPPSVRLFLGSRVIAYFDASLLARGKEKLLIQSAFYPGVIAEPLKQSNKFRYLIFYDDGYTQYVSPKDVRMVCHVSENVWEDVYPGSRDFIQNYLTQYMINRPMVQTQKGQSMTTESNGKWAYARVIDIDCSLIQMQFDGGKNHTEWIYRGSLRLGPVFKEHQKTMQNLRMPISRLPKRTEPFIRYTEDEEATSTEQDKRRQLQQQVEPRAVARKSTNRNDPQNVVYNNSTVMPIVRHLNNSTIYLEDENKPKGKVVYYTAKRNIPPLLYRSHMCTPACPFKITHNLSAYSPLSKPLLSGWERLLMQQRNKKFVSYRSPCGKILRNMKELHHYLRVTNNVLNVDNFDFCPDTSCLAEYVIENPIIQRRDIAGGQEKMAIPLVNSYDYTMPPEFKYSAQRIPTEGVNLNVDEEFLVGCDCVDDCSDKGNCSCWQLTYAGAKYGSPPLSLENIGYQYKRLYEPVRTGIYECNSRCKCKMSCLNRVVQHMLEMKLQVFKTSNRGWGLRCINDIPRGSFICVYAGHLLTEAQANEGGLDAGDEYFAELDYIEVAEQIKEGYESDVSEPEREEEDYYDRDDDEFTPSKPLNIRPNKKSGRQTKSAITQNTEEDSQERQMINFNPNAVMDESTGRESSIRKLYGKDEACYVMDAKITGNLGRYFNHSCSPNLFVQSVFVDTHDLRFPWVAFFASTHIHAGTELTWNYNYEVGVVPGKVLYCQCGASNCRLRLL